MLQDVVIRLYSESVSSAPEAFQGALDLDPAPNERVRHKIRRWYRSAGHRRGLHFWLMFRGLPAIVVWAVLYVANGFVIGWRNAYDVMLAIISPADTTSPVVAWPLSVVGWLAAPGIAGAVAGYVVTSSIQGRRRTKPEELYGGDRRE